MKRIFFLGFVFLIIIAAGTTVIRIPSPCDCPAWDSLVCTISPLTCEQCYEECEELQPPRYIPIDLHYYDVPRQVGVNLQFKDKSCGPLPWWHVNCENGVENWIAVDNAIRDYDIYAFGIMMEANPFYSPWEPIDKLFRTPLADILVIRPEHWGSQDYLCSDEGMVLGGVKWENYPDSIFNDIYDQYAGYVGRERHIFITNTEADWQAYGTACRERDQCIKFERYYDYLEQCQNGIDLVTGIEYTNESCFIRACDAVKADRAHYVVELSRRRQRSAELSRNMNPGTNLRVWHVIEVNFYGNQPWQTFTMLEKLTEAGVYPDFYGLALYNQAGDPVEALQYAMQITGLPAKRFFISETGHKDLDKQYDKIYNRIDGLFQEGVAFALVWDLEVTPVYNTGYSIVDRETGEWNPGMYAVRDLNEKWRD